MASEPQTLWRSPTAGGGTAKPTENEQALGLDSQPSCSKGKQLTLQASVCSRIDVCPSKGDTCSGRWQHVGKAPVGHESGCDKGERGWSQWPGSPPSTLQADRTRQQSSSQAFPSLSNSPHSFSRHRVTSFFVSSKLPPGVQLGSSPCQLSLLILLQLNL